MMLKLIVAADLDDCIGKDGDIPWKLPSDLKRFKQLTIGHACILGSKTHASILNRLGHALPERRSYVVSRTEHGGFVGGMFVSSPENALAEAKSALQEPDNSSVFVLGGAQIYQALLPAVDKILLTRVHTRVNGDTYMPQNWLGGFMQTEASPATREDKDEYETSYTTYERYGGPNG